MVQQLPGLSSVTYELGPEGGNRRLELARGLPEFPPDGEFAAISAGVSKAGFHPSRARKRVFEESIARGLMDPGEQPPSLPAERLALAQVGWDVEVRPASRRGQGRVPLGDAYGQTIGELGIVPGSTLRFTRAARSTKGRRSAG